MPPSSSAASRLGTSFHRCGNALVLALVIAGSVMALILTSTTGAVSTFQQAVRATDALQLQAALEAVLARRQQDIIHFASSGRPEDLISWAEAPNEVWDHPNYGVDTVNGIEVRWKIEPAYTDPTSTAGFVQNPNPGSTGSLDNELPNNGSFYLYRIAGEARQYTPDGVHLAGRVQGAKYIITPNESALNYLIYYAQRGLKGDLELTHGPEISLQGGIYSGGATYIGAGTQVNDWLALWPVNGATIIGPPAPCPWPTWSNGTSYGVGALVQSGTDPIYSTRKFQCTAAHLAASDRKPGDGANWMAYWQEVTRIQVTSLDGVYRMSKALLYGAFNALPMANSPPSGFSSANPDQSYDRSTGAGQFPGESGTTPTFTTPTGSSFSAATLGGTAINPARVLDWGPAPSGKTLATRPVSTATADTQRLVMGVALRGFDQGTAPNQLANDARPRAGSSFDWKSDSLEATAPGFNRLVRSIDNGGQEITFAPQFRDRPAEPQKLHYDDLDGDSSTDEHEFARPTFLNGSSPYDPTSQIEVPGHYLSRALGAGRYMRRLDDMTGWTVVSASGTADTGTPEHVGLVIRERPRPAIQTYTPSATPVPAGTPTYMPFAYGKWNRPVYAPFCLADVYALQGFNDAAGVHSDDKYVFYSGPERSNDNVRKAGQISSYIEGGGLYLRTNTGKGPTEPNGSSGSIYTWWHGWPGGALQRAPHLFRENWRFAHLNRPEHDPSRHGYLAYFWDDRTTSTTLSPTTRPASVSYPNGPLSGPGLRFVMLAAGSGYSSDFFAAGGSIELRIPTGEPAAGAPTTISITGASAGRCAVTVAGGRITSIVVTTYAWAPLSAAPEVRIVGGGGTGARAVAITDPDGQSLNANAPRFIDPTIAYNGGHYTTWSSPPGQPTTLDHGYGARLETFLIPPESSAGTRYFGIFVRANDFVRLWVNDTMVSELWWNNEIDQVWGQVNFAAVPVVVAANKPNRVVVEYAKSTAGDFNLILVNAPSPVSASSFSSYVVPREQLYPPRVRADGSPAHTFRKSEFRAVQARLTGIATGLNGQRIGLMLRNADGMSPLLDGRDPYAALLYAPERGFFSQYRGAKARSETRTQLVHYVGQTAAGATIPADAAGQLFQGNRGNAQSPRLTRATIISGLIDPTSNTLETYQQTNTDDTTIDLRSQLPSFTVPEGVASPVTIGAITRTVKRQPVSMAGRNARYIVTFALDGTQAAGLLPIDNGQTIRLFADATTTAPLDTFPLSYNSPTTFSRTFSGGTGWVYNPGDWVASAPVTTGNAHTFWTLPTITNGSTVVRTMTVAETKSYLEAIYGGTFTYQADPGWPPPPSTTYPPYPVVANVSTTNLLTTAQQILYAVGASYTFAVDRSNQTFVFDLNPYVPTWGTWASASSPDPTNPLRPVIRPPTTTTADGYTRVDLQPLINPWNALFLPGSWNAPIPRVAALSPDQWIPHTVPGTLATASGPALPDVPVWNIPRSWFFCNPTVRLPMPPGGFANSGASNITAVPNQSGSTGLDGTTLAVRGSRLLNGRWPGDQPSSWNSAGLPEHIWLRMEKDAQNYIDASGLARTVLRMQYYYGSVAPAGEADFRPLLNEDGSEKVVDITGFSEQLLIGPCLQGYLPSDTVSCTFTDLSVQFQPGTVATSAAPFDVLDYRDWEGAPSGVISDYSKYMCSQYQVFFGNQDITEDFFTIHERHPDIYPERTAKEDWLLDQREFWSQSRWWDLPVSAEAIAREKDPGAIFPTAVTASVRELLAKTTCLSLDLSAIQNYLRHRSLSDAVSRPITDLTPPTVSSVSLASLAPPTPGGLVLYCARTNRYPWNPWVGSGGSGAKPNPFENAILPAPTVHLPNSISGSSDNDGIANLAADSRATALLAAADGVRAANHRDLYEDRATQPNSLQPYPLVAPSSSLAQGTLTHTPAFRPQDFHHAVRLRNGASIDWGLPDSGIAPFGTSKLTIATPNALQLQGDLNSVAHPFTYQGVTVNKVTPLAVLGDSVTLLSNAWNDPLAQQTGLSLSSTANTATVAAGGVLATGQVPSRLLPPALSTTYCAAILTHNLPTTKQSVILGEASSLINTMLFQEDWSLRDVNFVGSLVVMDSRRYTRGYQLDTTKTYGLTPFGWMTASTISSADRSSWWSKWSGLNSGYPAPAADTSWIGSIAPIYGAPNRKFVFQYDFLTKAGTPPEIPFGVKAQGLGGWMRIIR